MDPNTLNLDPDPGLCDQFLKKKFKIIFEKNTFFKLQGNKGTRRNV